MCYSICNVKDSTSVVRTAAELTKQHTRVTQTAATAAVAAAAAASVVAAAAAAVVAWLRADYSVQPP
jgi:hypothetical protein